MAYQQELHLKELKQFKDSRYGNVTLFQNPSTGGVYTRKDKVFQNKEQVKAVAKEIQKRISNPNLFYVAPLTFEFDSVDISQGQQAPLIKLYTPFPHETLDMELQKRIEKSRPMNNREITYLMYDLIYGMHHLQQLGFNHGKFGPEFVAKTTTGYAILDDPVYYQYDVIDLKRRKYWYLCPSAYQCAITNQKAGKTYNLIKSDVFALGLVLLEASIQLDIDDIYGDQQGKNLDFNALNQLTSLMESRYQENNLFTSTVKKMLSLREKDRPDFKEMVGRMPEYQMIKNYFEQVEMSPEDLRSMRNSLHGSLANQKDPQEFAKMTPSGSKGMRQSLKNSRYYEEDSEDKIKMDFFKKNMGNMIISEVVEKQVVQMQVSDLGTESDSYHPQIMIKTNKGAKKPPTPKKTQKECQELKEELAKNQEQNEAILALQKQVEMLTQTLMKQNASQKQEETPNVKFDSQKSIVSKKSTEKVDIEALVQQRVQEELLKFQALQMQQMQQMQQIQQMQQQLQLESMKKEQLAQEQKLQQEKEELAKKLEAEILAKKLEEERLAKILEEEALVKKIEKEALAKKQEEEASAKKLEEELNAKKLALIEASIVKKQKEDIHTPEPVEALTEVKTLASQEVVIKQEVQEEQEEEDLPEVTIFTF